MLKDLVLKNRACRRFDETKKIEKDVLRKLVDLARLSASAANMQPLKFYISNEQEMNNKINDCLKWAGYLKGWSPQEGERATAFMVRSRRDRSSSIVAA